MRIGPLRLGELLALLGLVVLVGSAFVDWFALDRVDVCHAAVSDGSPLSPETCAILTQARGLEDSAPIPGTSLSVTALGQPWFGLLVLFAWGVVLTLVAALRSGPGRPTFWPVAAATAVTALGFVVLATTAVRLFAARPTTDATIMVEPAMHVRDLEMGLAAGTAIGLAGLVLTVVGLWVLLRDERLNDRRNREVRRPEPRPVPAPSPRG